MIGATTPRPPLKKSGQVYAVDRLNSAAAIMRGSIIRNVPVGPARDKAMAQIEDILRAVIAATREEL